MIRKLIILFFMSLGSFIVSCGGGHPEQRPAIASLAYDPPAKIASRKLCVFMDGTSNKHDSQTHIRQLYEIISGRGEANIISYYDPGVGATRYPVTGAIAGAGFTSNIREAYAFLASYYQPGDEIYVFGYSRGARQAQVLSDLVCRCGLPNLDIPASKKDFKKRIRQVSSIVSNYKAEWKRAKKNSGNRRDEETPPRFDLTGRYQPGIEFLGMWDNVDSLANPVMRSSLKYLRTFKPVEYQPHNTYPYTLPNGVRKCYHAASLDEIRGHYEVIPWILPKGRSLENVQMVWFPGTHGDVGGSYDSSEALSKVSLNWMLGKLRSSGLLPREDYSVYAKSEALAVDSMEFLGMNLLGKIRLDRVRRPVLWGDFWSATENQGKKVEPMIHQSVLDRIKASSVTVQRGNKKIEESDRNQIYRPRIFQKPDDRELPHKGLPFMEHENPSAEQMVDWLKKNTIIVQ